MAPVDGDPVNNSWQVRQRCLKSFLLVEFEVRRGDRVVYGGGLENRFRLLGERGFESHPLRQLERECFDPQFFDYSHRWLSVH